MGLQEEAAPACRALGPTPSGGPLSLGKGDRTALLHLVPAQRHSWVCRDLTSPRRSEVRCSRGCCGASLPGSTASPRTQVPSPFPGDVRLPRTGATGTRHRLRQGSAVWHPGPPPGDGDPAGCRATCLCQVPAGRGQASPRRSRDLLRDRSRGGGSAWDTLSATVRVAAPTPAHAAPRPRPWDWRLSFQTGPHGFSETSSEQVQVHGQTEGGSYRDFPGPPHAAAPTLSVPTEGACVPTDTPPWPHSPAHIRVPPPRCALRGSHRGAVTESPRCPRALPLTSRRVAAAVCGRRQPSCPHSGLVVGCTPHTRPQEARSKGAQCLGGTAPCRWFGCRGSRALCCL